MHVLVDAAFRWRIVCAFAQCPNYKKIARELKCNIKTVRKWVRTHKRTQSVMDKERSGRPAKLAADNPQLVQLLEDGIRCKLGCSALAASVRSTFGVECSGETIRRFIRKHLQARRLKPRKKPTLTNAHKAARLEFCLRLQRTYRGREMCDDTCYSDSKYFWLQARGTGDRVWVIYGEEHPIQPAEQHCHKVHVYAAVSKHGKTSLFETVGTTGMQAESKGVNASVYLDLLQTKLIPACRQMMLPHIAQTRSGRTQAKWVFQQDNAKPHTAKKVARWLSEQEDFDVLKWPSKSPDLSWIENVWGYIARKVNDRPNLTRENFKEALMEEWDAMPLTKLVAFYNSISKRVYACMDENGGVTKY